eukprot:12609432-Alexandrium_andersonii.AAC.1
MLAQEGMCTRHRIQDLLLVRLGVALMESVAGLRVHGLELGPGGDVLARQQRVEALRPSHHLG